jgi:hypothetical protein
MKILSKIKNWLWPNKENNFQPGVLNDRVISVFILLFLLSKVLFSFQLILIQQSALFADLNAQRIIALTNDIRQQYGLSLLKENPLLDAAAKQKAEDMFQNNYFSHFSPTGVSPWYWISKSGYDYHYAGENLAMNFIDSEEVVRAWLNSPGHRENLLNNNYQDIGIAVLPADFSKPGINQPIVVQLFGSLQIEKIRPTTETTNPALAKAAPSTTVPPSAKKEVLGEEKEEAPTTVPTTVTTITPSTTETSTTLPVATLSVPIVSNLQVDARTQIDVFNKIIAFGLIILGSIVILGIILNQRAIPFEFSEIVLRGGILVFIGAAFLAFHLERFIGQLVIS